MNVVSLCFIEFSHSFCSGSRDGVSWRSRHQWLVSLSSNSFLQLRSGLGWAVRCHVEPAVPRVFFVCISIRCGPALVGEPTLLLVLFLSFCFEVEQANTRLAWRQNFENLASAVFTLLFTRLDARLTNAHYWCSYQIYASTFVFPRNLISAFMCNSALSNGHCTVWPWIVQWSKNTEWVMSLFLLLHFISQQRGSLKS